MSHHLFAALALSLAPATAMAGRPVPDSALPPLIITTPESAVTSQASAPTPVPEDDEVSAATDESLRVLLASPFVTFEVRPDVAKGFDKESRGRYSATRKRLKDCRDVPVKFLWEEFAPFFSYRWDREFVNFAALMLAIWERESLFALPAQGVHVNPNCTGRGAKVVKPLHGASLAGDLRQAAKKDAALAAAFGDCSLRIADFGPLQWNHRWRLSAEEYRADIERVLLLTTKYSQKELRKLDAVRLASLVKYNPKALFLLGGLSLREGARTSKATIEAYNTNPEYRSAVSARRLDFLRLLRKGGSRCSGS